MNVLSSFLSREGDKQDAGGEDFPIHAEAFRAKWKVYRSQTGIWPRDENACGHFGVPEFDSWFCLLPPAS